MAHQTLNIWGGQLCVDNLKYQLYRADGEAITYDYRGPGYRGDGKVSFEHGSLNVITLTIAQYATAESTQFSNGYDKALAQQRRREPKNCDIWYWRGWYAAWEDKKAGRV